jgi:hypothetical protein
MWSIIFGSSLSTAGSYPRCYGMFEIEKPMSRFSLLRSLSTKWQEPANEIPLDERPPKNTETRKESYPDTETKPDMMPENNDDEWSYVEKPFFREEF